MKYAFCGGKLLDGTREMQPREGLVLRTDGDRITDIVPEGTDLTGYEVVDLKGGYLMPGLINMHVHLAGSGKPQKKQRDNEKLVKTILSTGLTRKVAYGMVAGFAKEELFSGVTTIRTVGGLADFDTRLRDDIRAGRRVGPRILAANEGISVPGGHMAGSVAVAAHTIDEALAQLEKGRQQGVDLVKLMITGGVLDAKEKGVPGELKMPPEMVKVVCERAHEMGYIVAAHVESPEGVRVALENGVDSIEHGAKPDADILRLFRERGAFLCTTISPALPYALFDRSVSNASEVEQYNGNVVFEGIIDCAKAALEQDIPVVLGYLGDDGYLHVQSRNDDMIIVGGENVHPQSVVEVLEDMPGVGEVYAHGVDDEQMFKRIAVWVVRSADITADAVRDWVRAHLADHSIPRDVHFVDELPRNAVGKVVPRFLPGLGQKN